MKVGFIAPIGIATVNGGVRTQVLQTAAALQTLGVEIQFLSPWQDSFDVDLVHVFVASIDNLGILNRCSELGIKIALSPVFFSNRSASTISTSLLVERLIGRFISGIRSDFGVKAEACRLASIILPNTSSETELISKGFNIPYSKISTVPNGVETRFVDASSQLFIDKYGIKDFVLFVGQAGAPRKNVFNLMKAAPNIDSKIVVIGSLYDDDYSNSCRKLAEEAGNVLFIDNLDHESDLLASAYAACSTFVLPSYFETPGIAALEAALTGANVAITQRGGTNDYFRNWAVYLDPESPSSIAEAVNISLGKDKSEELKNHILEHYTWDNVGEATLKGYSSII